MSFSLLSGVQASFAATCGSLAAVKGKVEVLRMQPKSAGEAVRYGIAGKDFMPVECEDIVITDPSGSAKMILGDDKITLAPDSRIEIAQHSGSVAKPKVDLLNLTYGKMRGLIKKRSLDNTGKGAFRVRTFSAVVGVRGTDLFASFDSNAGITEQAVIEGKVEVTQIGTQQKVLVEAGQQVSVETTAAAVEAAKQRAAGKGASAEDIDKAPPPADVVEKAKTLRVEPIRESLKKDMRIASAIVKDDPEFATPKAVSVLGTPKTWTIEREDVPAKLKGIENEF